MTRNRRPDTVDARFIVNGGKEVDLPHVRWLLHNRHRFRQKMPLMEFLRLMPVWLLREAEASEESLRGATTDADYAECSASLTLTMEHLAHWSQLGDGRIELSEERIAQLVPQFLVACALEMQRRCGVLRVHVEGEDRLDVEPRRTLQMNPVIIEELRRRGAPLDPTSSAMAGLWGDLLPLALRSPWAEPDQLLD